jgi:hypothetical protein
VGPLLFKLGSSRSTTHIFNSVTGVDDFAMADLCDLFASTSNGGAIWPNQLISAGRGKVCYNVESHINAGQISLHQRPLELNDVLSDLLPQVGAGVKGFLFWQYRPEVLEDSKQRADATPLGGETASVGGAHLAGTGHYPIQLTTGEILAGADTFAELTNGAWTSIAHYGEQTVIATRQLEKGSIFYCGANLGAALKSSPEGSKALLDQVLDQAQVTAPQLVSAAPGVEFDILYQNDAPAFIVLNNCGSADATVNLDEAHTWTGLFSGKTASASHP